MCGLGRNGQSLHTIAEVMKADGLELSHFRVQKNIEACLKSFLARIRSLLAQSPGQRLAYHDASCLYAGRVN